MRFSEIFASSASRFCNSFAGARALKVQSYAPLLCVTAGLVLACESRREKSEAPAVKLGVAASRRTRSSEKPKFVRAVLGAEPAARMISEQREQALRENLTLLVYVGASWCEPCQYFHQAVEQGKLDQLLAGTRLLEFDEDIHGDALRSAGYAYKLIPVIALPDKDGQSSGALISGSIKGPRAVDDNLVPRIATLLNQAALN